jgi:UDP-glucose 4-epimerase
MEGRRVLVTGGAGFIGSHLVDTLMEEKAEVRVIDNLTSGSIENIKRWVIHPSFEFIRGDLLNEEDIKRTADGCELVFHLAANPEVRVGASEPRVHFDQNAVSTYHLLEALRKSGTLSQMVFTSSSTVYGDASEIPTPEDHGPLKPISIYGASKLASEALISSFAHTYGFKAIICRLANIVGPRSKHGVIYDFIEKLRANPTELEILGDGTQRKSYLYVDDCVSAMMTLLERAEGRVEIFNVGSEDWVDVKTIAKIVMEEMGLKDVSFRFTGGVDGGRGWKGDVKYMLLSIEKLKALGWRPKLNSAEAVRKTARGLLGDEDPHPAPRLS